MASGVSRPRSVRPLIFWPHLILGLAAGLVIFVMSITGVLLTYQRQIQFWADTRGVAAPAPGATPRPVADLVARAAAAFPATGDAPPPAQVTIRRDPAAPAQIAVNGHTVYVNRYTGDVHGEGALGLRAFFRSVTNWHRWLALDGASRTTARAVTGAANLVFVFLGVSGLYLWMPRTWTRAAVRNITVFRRGLLPKARDFNWHNVFGFWMAIPIIIVAGSGAVISYPWASNLVYRAAGEAPPTRGGGPGGRGAGPGGRGDAEARVAEARVAEAREASGGASEGASGGAPDIDALFATAASREPDWTSVGFRMPADASPVAFAIDRGTGGQPQTKSTLTLDARTGAETRYERFSDQSRGRRWRSWMRFLHTGEAWGLFGQTLAGIASFAGVVLVYSGVALSWRRFFPRRSSSSSSSSSSASRSHS